LITLARLKEVLWVVAVFGAVAIVARLLGGLGAVTDLSDAMPWGMWKILNMVAGVALATGGFALAATVYIFKLEKYRPVIKPAIAVAFLGYGSSCFALFLDIGLPHAIWKPIVFWNHHSFLFEVAWCVMLYFSVTILELAPTVLEKYGFEKWIGLLHKVSIPIVIVGITLSSLHHTSLGSLFLVMPARLHPLWFTSWLPVLFILSAVGAGIFMVVLVSLAYARLYGRPLQLPVLTGLSTAAAVILGLYLVAKAADLVLRHQTGLLLSGQWEVGFFAAEVVLGAVLPILLVAIPATRKSPTGLAVASVSAVIGLVLYRLNVGVTGLLRTSEVAYFPSLTEISLSLGLIAMAGLVLIYLVENYRVFENTPAKTHLVSASAGVRALDRPGRLRVSGSMSAPARISLLVVISASVALAAFSAEAFEGVELDRSPIRPPLGVNKARTVLLINGDRDDDAVRFPHQEHIERLGDDASCSKCHHLNLPGDQSSACYRCHRDMNRKTSIFDHASHVAKLDGNWSCQQCHDAEKPKNLANSKACDECHADDMGLEPPRTGRFDFWARSYADAMHGMCVKCHEEEDQKAGEARLATCQACHGNQHSQEAGSPAEERLGPLTEGETK